MKKVINYLDVHFTMFLIVSCLTISVWIVVYVETHPEVKGKIFNSQ